jgi:hypothetical protein
MLVDGWFSVREREEVGERRKEVKVEEEVEG